MPAIALNTTMDMWGVKVPVGPEELGLMLLGFLIIVGLYVLVIVVRWKLGR